MAATQKINVFSHQEQVFQKLCAIANASFDLHRDPLPITLRTNSLLIGSSGSGKTFLARAVAEATGSAFLSVSISEWVLLGCTSRGAVCTWPSIVQFLIANKEAKGVVIFLDELDKLSGKGSWEAFQRTEIFKLLDLSIPSGITDSDNELISGYKLRLAQHVLSSRTLIIGAGAFQELWDVPAKSCAGFGTPAAATPRPTLEQLCKMLPRELVNRFRSEVMVLPQLELRDYEEMLLRTTEAIPSSLQKLFLDLGLGRLEQALESKQGCRFVEELLLDTILLEREAMNRLSAADLPSMKSKSTLLKAFKSIAP